VPHMYNNAPAGSRTSWSLVYASFAIDPNQRWTVAHHLKTTCEQSTCWCMTSFAAFTVAAGSNQAPCCFLLRNHPSCLMHVVQVQCMTILLMVFQAWPTMSNFSEKQLHAKHASAYMSWQCASQSRCPS